jgi:hypothetical protein
MTASDACDGSFEGTNPGLETACDRNAKQANVKFMNRWAMLVERIMSCIMHTQGTVSKTRGEPNLRKVDALF